MSDKINKEALAAHRKKVRDDWFTIRALLKIDMKSRFGYGTRIGAGNVGKWIFNFIMSGLMYAIIVFLILLFTQMFVARSGNQQIQMPPYPYCRFHSGTAAR